MPAGRPSAIYHHEFGFTEEKFELLEAWFAEWSTPRPPRLLPHTYKIFTIASGVLAMNFSSCSLASSAPPAFLIAALLAKFGEPMKEFIDKHFNKLALLFSLCSAVSSPKIPKG